MVWPLGAVNNTNTTSGSTPGQPAAFRSDANDLTAKVNQIIAHVSGYMQSALAATTQKSARSLVGAPCRNVLVNPDFMDFGGGAGGPADGSYITDQWYNLSQNAAGVSVSFGVFPAGLGDVTNVNPIAITQNQATAGRIGVVQPIELAEAAKLRGSVATASVRIRMSVACNVRAAILSWTGTSDTITRDVVNNWTSTTYTPGNFFASTNLSVVAVSSALALAASTPATLEVSGSIPDTANNLFVFFWSEDALAQNVIMRVWDARLTDSTVRVEVNRRDNSDEVFRAQRFWERIVVQQTQDVTNAVAYRHDYYWRTPKRIAPATSVSSGMVGFGAPTTTAVSETKFGLTATASATATGRTFAATIDGDARL